VPSGKDDRWDDSQGHGGGIADADWGLVPRHFLTAGMAVFHHFPQVDAHAHPGNAGKNTGKHRKILAIGASLLNEPSPP
jgi:hypothetical protein